MSDNTIIVDNIKSVAGNEVKIDDISIFDFSINYLPKKIFNKNDLTFYSGQLYESKVDNNLNKNPITETSSWRPFINEPIGKPFPWFDVTPPDGCLTLDGSLIGTSAYSRLFSIYQYRFGGSGVNFNLPDFQTGGGRVIRAYDPASGRTIGDYQADEFKSHTHVIDGSIGPIAPSTIRAEGQGWHRSDSTGATGGSETRSKNLCALMVARY